MAIIQRLSDFRMTLIALAAALACSVLLIGVNTLPARTTDIVIPLLFSLFGFAGLFADFMRLRRSQKDIAHQQRELILQATLFTMMDTTRELRHDLQHLCEQAELGAQPDLDSLNHLRELFNHHVLRLQQLGDVGTISLSWANDKPLSNTRSQITEHLR